MRASLITLAAGLALLGSGAASAQAYVGAGVGSGHISADCSGTTSCDTSSTGAKLYGGYLVNPALGVELGYFDWGKAKATTSVLPLAGSGGQEAPQAITPIAASATLKATGFGLGVAYLPQLSADWNAVLRAGVAQNKGKVSVDGGSGTSKTSTQPYVGLGVGYLVTPNLTLTGELDFSRVKWNDGTADATDAVRLVTIGLRFKF